MCFFLRFVTPSCAVRSIGTCKMNGPLVCLMEKTPHKTSVCKQNKRKQIISGICLNSHVNCANADAVAHIRSNDVQSRFWPWFKCEFVGGKKTFSFRFVFSIAMHFQVCTLYQCTMPPLLNHTIKSNSNQMPMPIPMEMQSTKY